MLNLTTTRNFTQFFTQTNSESNNSQVFGQPVKILSKPVRECLRLVTYRLTHVRQGLLTHARTDGQPENIMPSAVPPHRGNGGGIEIIRERKCADTVGTVLVPRAGHFQC